jgi:hypothetical protein
MLLLFCSGALVAQTTEGTEFWVTFMNNENNESGSSEMQLKLIVSSRYNATISVSNPQTDWSTTFRVTANQIANQVLPHTQCYTFAAEKAENHGLLVTSDNPISLFAANYSPHSYDATIVLPIKALGKDYIIQTYEDIPRPYLM